MFGAFPCVLLGGLCMDLQSLISTVSSLSYRGPWSGFPTHFSRDGRLVITDVVTVVSIYYAALVTPELSQQLQVRFCHPPFAEEALLSLLRSKLGTRLEPGALWLWPCCAASLCGSNPSPAHSVPVTVPSPEEAEDHLPRGDS